jgi:hypothetical protein
VNEKQNQKGNSAKENPFSFSQLLPVGVGFGAMIWGCCCCCRWGCIKKITCPWASSVKKGVSLSETTNLSEAKIEYVRITFAITGTERTIKYTTHFDEQHTDCSLLLSFSFLLSGA